MAEGFTSRSSKEPVVLPTAPRAARDSRIDEDVPTNPPYVAYLTNLPYDVDEAYLTEFFAEMKVNLLKSTANDLSLGSTNSIASTHVIVSLQISNIRLPKDSNKLKGYGYVEFEDRSSEFNRCSQFIQYSEFRTPYQNSV